MTWLKRGALAIALFVAGAVAGDFAVRGNGSTAPTESASAPVHVVHKRTVRTVHVHPHRGAGTSPASSAAQSTVSAPASAPTATPVNSGASPGAAGGGGGGEVEHDD